MASKKGILLGQMEVLQHPISCPLNHQTKRGTSEKPLECVQRDSREKLMFYHRGFKDGVSASAKRHPNEASYLRGYDDGSKNRSEATLKYCSELGYDPSKDILRGGE
jgi:hypothetical protein